MINMHGISGKILNWIRNFPSNRQQKVKVGNIFYKTTDVTSGVPQGSILGPILLIIYINALPDCVSSTCKIFADDTKLYNFSSKQIFLQIDSNSLKCWSDMWQLHFNIKNARFFTLVQTILIFIKKLIMKKHRCTLTNVLQNVT